MKIRSCLSVTLVSSLILVGCDQCSGKKESAPSSQSAGGAASPEAAPTDSSLTAPQETPTSGEQPSSPGTTETMPAGTDSTTVTGSETATSTDSSQTGTPGAKAEVQITDIKVGTGPEAVDGKRVTVHYTGTLENGTKFDSSKDRGTPFPFILGSGMVITGWEKGLVGMKEGGIRKLVIPPSLAYGEKSVGGVIPPNSTLVFEVELLKVE